jgi:transcriptional regulator with XRE-family HTH domain
MGNNMTSEEFKAIRIALDLTQTELGLLMGMKQQAIQRIETKRAPTSVHAAFIEMIDRYMRGVPWEGVDSR